MTKKYINLYQSRQEKLLNDKKNMYFDLATKKQKYGDQYTFKPKINS